MTKRVVIESPLNGPTPEAIARNFRFLLWCCRAVWLREGLHPIASHLICPWFMNDAVGPEREAGIDNAWVWGEDAPHRFFMDLGFSHGMELADARCAGAGISRMPFWLRTYAPECWAAFERGEWPPHTKGFELAGGVS